jgi:hypothetical protein
MGEVVEFRDPYAPYTGAKRLAARRAYRVACKAIAADFVGGLQRCGPSAGREGHCSRRCRAGVRGCDAPGAAACLSALK